jgi:hypothetical protein
VRLLAHKDQPDGRGLLVGGMPHLRTRLAGSALRRRAEGVPQLLDADGTANPGTVSTKLDAALYARPHRRTCDGETTQARCGTKAAGAVG